MTDHRSGPVTQRLLLRALTVADAEAFFALNRDPEVMRFTDEPPLESLEEATHAIANYPDFDTVGYGRWGCVLKNTQKVIGFCGLKYLDELDVVDVGYRLLPQYWGQGLATEACQASVAYGFEVLGLQQIIGLVLPGNTASIRVLEKVGMRPEGKVTYQGKVALKFSLQRQE